MALLGKYEVHHSLDGGLVKNRSCTKCQRHWTLFQHWFNFGEYYSVKVGKNKREDRKNRLQTKVAEGKLREGYSSWSKYLPDQVIIFSELLPKWRRKYRVVTFLLLVGLVVYLLQYFL